MSFTALISDQLNVSASEKGEVRVIATLTLYDLTLEELARLLEKGGSEGSVVVTLP